MRFKTQFKTTPEKRAYARSQYQKHREKRLAYQRSNRKEALERKRKWIREHPDYWREYCRIKMHEYYRRKHPVVKHRSKYT